MDAGVHELLLEVVPRRGRLLRDEAGHPLGLDGIGQGRDHAVVGLLLAQRIDDDLAREERRLLDADAPEPRAGLVALVALLAELLQRLDVHLHALLEHVEPGGSLSQGPALLRLLVDGPAALNAKLGHESLGRPQHRVPPSSLRGSPCPTTWTNEKPEKNPRPPRRTRVTLRSLGVERKEGVKRPALAASYKPEANALVVKQNNSGTQRRSVSGSVANRRIPPTIDSRSHGWGRARARRPPPEAGVVVPTPSPRC